MEKFDNLVQMVLLTENPTFCDKELPINLNDIQTNKNEQ